MSRPGFGADLRPGWTSLREGIVGYGSRRRAGALSARSQPRVVGWPLAGHIRTTTWGQSALGAEPTKGFVGELLGDLAWTADAEHAAPRDRRVKHRLPVDPAIRV